MTNQTAGKADYSYWLSVRMWSADEAAALFLGYEPDYADYGDGPFPPVEPDPDRLAIAKAARKLERVLVSAQLAGEFGKVELNQLGKPWGKTVTAIQWIKWAKKNSVELADELLEAVEEVRTQPQRGDEPIHPRTETTLLRIIGALLREVKENTDQSQASIIERIVDQHGHKPGISRSTLENSFSNANKRLDEW